ncbi:MAG: hypothetical protein HC831_00995 [Chloroflexia bacterium]|nr:hypothetical protein [Chloroflexia bacterium]
MNPIADILQESGWALGQKPFAEKASHGATYYFSYQNRKNNELGLAIFENENRIRFRVFDFNE